ncbi:MAG: hypothetical protein ACREDH_13535 [Methylocella sp.]
MALDGDKLDAILGAIAAGEPARKACALVGIPHPTFYGALNADQALADRYAQARARGLDAVADEIIAIADGADSGSADVARLRVDSRKWLLAKLAPKKYGERTIIAGDADNPVDIRHSVASRLLPELAADEPPRALGSPDRAGAERPRLRMARLLGAGGATAAVEVSDGNGDILADHGGPGMGKNTNGSGTGS